MDTVFLEEHACSHTFWVVPSLFQEATCSDLVFSRVLCFFETSTCSDPFFKGIELIRNSSCSHPFHERPFFYYKKANAATHIFKFTEFLQDRNCSMKIFIVLGFKYIYWKKYVIWWHQFQSFIFSMEVSLFHESSWSHPSSLWLIQQNWKGMFILGKPMQSCSFKCACLFHRISCSNFCLKSVVVNAWKYLQLPHSFMGNVSIW